MTSNIIFLHYKCYHMVLLLCADKIPLIGITLLHNANRSNNQNIHTIIGVEGIKAEYHPAQLARRCVIRLGRRAQPSKFILPQFVSYLGERGVLSVGNVSHFCRPVLVNVSGT